MAYRVRARRSKVVRYRLVDFLGNEDAVTSEAYRSLRDQLITAYADRLELMSWLWLHEPGVPPWLRDEPPRGDPRMLAHAWAEPELDDEAAVLAHEAAELAYQAVMAGRRRWLAENGYPTDHSREETPYR